MGPLFEALVVPLTQKMVPNLETCQDVTTGHTEEYEMLTLKLREHNDKDRYEFFKMRRMVEKNVYSDHNITYHVDGHTNLNISCTWANEMATVS